MAITPMYDIIVTLAGTPMNDYQEIIAYFAAAQLTVLFVYGILALFRSFIPTGD